MSTRGLVNASAPGAHAARRRCSSILRAPPSSMTTAVLARARCRAVCMPTSATFPSMRAQGPSAGGRRCRTWAPPPARPRRTARSWWPIQLRDFLENGNIRNSVNFPEAVLPRQCRAPSRLAIANRNVPNMVGQISTCLAAAELNIADLLEQARAANTPIRSSMPKATSTRSCSRRIARHRWRALGAAGLTAAPWQRDARPRAKPQGAQREPRSAPHAARGHPLRASMRVDAQIHALLNERARFAQLVGISKSASGKAVDFYRPEREAEVLRRALERNQGPLRDEEIARLFREIMSACLAQQEPLKVAFLGPEGTFTQAAVLKHFGSLGARFAARRRSMRCFTRWKAASPTSASCRSRTRARARSTTRSTCSWARRSRSAARWSCGSIIT